MTFVQTYQRVREATDRGIIKVRPRVFFNQGGVLVAEFKRLVLVPKKPPACAQAH